MVSFSEGWGPTRVSPFVRFGRNRGDTQLGIDPKQLFGYGAIEPLIQMRKDGLRKIGTALGMAV